jgi:hypothetical protein
VIHLPLLVVLLPAVLLLVVLLPAVLLLEEH